MEIKIVRYNTIPNPLGKTLAFLDIDYYGMIIKGLKVVNGEKGLFISYPREKGKDEKYYDIVYPFDMNLKGTIERMCLDYHKQQTNQHYHGRNDD